MIDLSTIKTLMQVPFSGSLYASTKVFASADEFRDAMFARDPSIEWLGQDIGVGSHIENGFFGAASDEERKALIEFLNANIDKLPQSGKMSVL